MNLLKSPLPRTTAAVAGALIGLAGVLVTGSPAGAHHPIVSVGPRCQDSDGSWEVTWHVLNSEQDIPGKIRELVTEPNVPVEGLAVGTVLPLPRDGVVKGTHKLPAGVESSTLKIRGEWVRDGQTIVNEAFHPESVVTVDKPEQRCESTPSPSSPTPSSPSPGPSVSPSVSPSPSVPAEQPGVPTPIVDGDCTTMTLGMDNPEDGLPRTLTFKTSKGEERTVQVAPGERKTEKFSATEGFKVTVTLTGEGESASETIGFQKPADCAAGGGGGELALTGAAAGSIAGGAGTLLAIGAGLFFLARRRNVKFTA